MSELSYRLPPRHLEPVIKNMLPSSSIDQIQSHAKELSQKIFKAFPLNNCLEDQAIRLSKKDSKALPFTVQVLRTSKGFDIHFIPNSSPELMRKGRKKVKPSFFLHVPKSNLHLCEIPFEKSFFYRVPPRLVESVKTAQQIHRQVIETWGVACFTKAAIFHPITKNGKLEMRAIAYDGDLYHAIIYDTLGFLDRIRTCLNLAKGVELLGSMIPAVVHTDIKPDNVFLEDKLGKIGDFDEAKHPCIKNWQLGHFTQCSHLFRFGVIHPKVDLYSLGVLIGEVLSFGFEELFSFVLSQRKIAKDLLPLIHPFEESLMAFSRYKKKIPIEMQEQVEKLFWGEEPLKQLALYAKSVKDTPSFRPISEFVLACSVYPFVFDILSKTLTEEQKVRNVRDRFILQSLLTTYCIYSAREVQQLLQKAKDQVAALTDFWEGKTDETVLEMFQSKENGFAQIQIIDRSEVKKLFEKLEVSDEYLHSFCDKIQTCLNRSGKEPFVFGFGQRKEQGFMGKIPFRGGVEKTEEGIRIYASRLGLEPSKGKEAYLKTQKVFFLFLPRAPSENNQPSLGTCLWNVFDKNNLNEYQQDYENVISLKSSLEEPEAFFSRLFVKNLDEGKGLLHGYNLLYNELLLFRKNALSTKQKITVCLDLVRELRDLQQQCKVHRRICSDNILLKEEEGGSIQAKLSNFSWLRRSHSKGQEHLEKVFWNYLGQKGYSFLELDLYSFSFLLWELFAEKWFKKTGLKTPELNKLQDQEVGDLFREVNSVFLERNSELGENFSQRILQLSKQVANIGHKKILEDFALDAFVYSQVLSWIVSIKRADDLMKKNTAHPLTELKAQALLKQFPFPGLDELESKFTTARDKIESFLQ